MEFSRTVANEVMTRLERVGIIRRELNARWYAGPLTRQLAAIEDVAHLGVQTAQHHGVVQVLFELVKQIGIVVRRLLDRPLHAVSHRHKLALGDDVRRLPIIAVGSSSHRTSKSSLSRCRVRGPAYHRDSTRVE